jgi:hypothetical protein
MDTNIIALFLCMIVILLLIIKQIIFKKRRREQFTTDSLYKTEILKHLNYDISSIRNLAQLAHNAYNKDLYLPINTISSSETIDATNFTISGDLKINDKASFENILNNNYYYDLFYKGMIIPWATSDSDIPQNWGLCDGSRYYYHTTKRKYMNYEKITNDDKEFINKDRPIVATPDLRGRFILNENSTQNKSPKTNDTNPYTNNFKTLKYNVDLIKDKSLGYHEINEIGGLDKYKLTASNLPSHFHTVNVQYIDNYFDWGMGNTDGPITTHYDVNRIKDDDFFTEKKYLNDILTYWSQWHNFGLDFYKMNIVGNSDDYQMIATWESYTVNLKSFYRSSTKYEDYKYLTTFDNLNTFEEINTNTDTVLTNVQTEIDNTPQWYALYYIMKLC